MSTILREALNAILRRTDIGSHDTIEDLRRDLRHIAVIATDARAALSAEGQQEPVAWRRRSKYGWSYRSNPPSAHSPAGYEPLYDAPSLPSVVGESVDREGLLLQTLTIVRARIYDDPKYRDLRIFIDNATAPTPSSIRERNNG